jgi:hypothetical protein
MRAVALAKSQGILKRLDGSVMCDDCGRPAQCYDHRDYGQPLVVAPVCFSCNKARGSAVGWTPLTKQVSLPPPSPPSAAPPASELPPRRLRLVEPFQNLFRKDHFILVKWLAAGHGRTVNEQVRIMLAEWVEQNSESVG